MLVKPPIGGAGAKVLPSGVKIISSDANHSNSSGTPPAMASATSSTPTAATAAALPPPSEVKFLLMERDSMAQRAALQTARLTAATSQLGVAKKQASTAQATAASLATQRDVLTSKLCHRLSQDSKQGERCRVCVLLCHNIIIIVPNLC